MFLLSVLLCHDPGMSDAVFVELIDELKSKHIKRFTTSMLRTLATDVARWNAAARGDDVLRVLVRDPSHVANDGVTTQFGWWVVTVPWSHEAFATIEPHVVTSLRRDGVLYLWVRGSEQSAPTRWNPTRGTGVAELISTLRSIGLAAKVRDRDMRFPLHLI
jgi:hypothetical protein